MYLSEILSSFICGKPDFDPQVGYLAKRSIVDTMGAPMLSSSCCRCIMLPDAARWWG